MQNKGKICRVEGCGETVRAKGLCQKCYAREVTYSRIKAKKQAHNEEGRPQPVRASADIDAMLTPLHANIKYLKTRQREITKWLDTLNLIVEFLESTR